MFENLHSAEVHETYGREGVIADENVSAIEIQTIYSASSDVEDSRDRGVCL